jgi:hypothetical protein
MGIRSRASTSNDVSSSESKLDAYDLTGSVWLNMKPSEDGAELEDEQILFPTESPFVTELRDDRGSYAVAPDSADWVPPDILAVPDTRVVEENMKRRNRQRKTEGVGDSEVVIPRAAREYLMGANDGAADKLLEILDRGVETTTSKLHEAADARSLDRSFMSRLLAQWRLGARSRRERGKD